MREIRGDAKTIKKLLSDAKYSVDYYQREYRWETKHVTELIGDLSEKFLESHDSSRTREDVEKYGHYFLGSIILSSKDGKNFVIDGQQRLTTLTLLLIFLYRHLTDHELKGEVANLIFSAKYGKRSFNLDIPERTGCMEALFMAIPTEETEQGESVRNILARYSDIEEEFPKELLGATLPYFVDWLTDNVHFVVITAYSDEDAYTIFETMNDRGLSLTPTDMLKGYLLASIKDGVQRTKAAESWKSQVGKLRELGKDEDSDGIKAWLRSQHAESIRERRRGAEPLDFDLIGTVFHRWVRDHEATLGLSEGSDFARLITTDFSFYGGWYHRLRLAAASRQVGLESVYYNAENNFTLQYPVLLAPLRVGEKEEAALKKLQITSAYLDILIARRVWHFRSIDYSTMQYSMFQVMKQIRQKGAQELADILSARLEDELPFQSGDEPFRLHGTNGKQIHRSLARMTDFIGTSSGQPSRYEEYAVRSGKLGYEIEHVWANHPERHLDEFGNGSDFQSYRNRIGGLLLLQRSPNASYSDLPYAEKRDHYLKQNLLAQSFHEKAYERTPGFLRFIENSGLRFVPHAQFMKADLDARQLLYAHLAELIWNPGRLAELAR